MICYVALLRGINVGRAKRVPMAGLRELMTALGYAGVNTLLNSGNVVFSAEGGAAAGHARHISAAVAGNLEVNAHVVVVQACDFATIVAENPLRTLATDPSCLLVVFTQDGSGLSALAQLSEVSWSPDALTIGRRAAYLWCAEGVLKSKLVQTVSQILGDSVTMRNWATVEKIDALIKRTAGEHTQHSQLSCND